MIIDELIAVLGYDIRGEAELKRFNAGLEQTAMLAQRMAAMVVAAGTIAAGAMAMFGKSVIETSAEFEGFQTALETIEGSADKAKSSMAWISKFGKETPYEVAGVTAAFIKLRSYGIDPMDGTLRTLGDTASAMNKPLNQAVEALADAATFQFERLKEFGITSSQKGDQVTFSWTKNGKTLTKVVKKNGEDIRKFVLTNFGERFNGAMLKQSKTWNGMMSNLADSWTDFKRRVGAAGFFDTVKNRLSNLMDFIGASDGDIDKWAKRVSDGLSWGFNLAVDQIQAFIGDLKFLFGWIKLNGDWWQPIKYGLMALGAIVFPKTFALLVLQDAIRWLQGKGSVIGDFAKSLSELTGMDVGTSGTLLASLAAAGASFLLFGGTFMKVAGGVRALAVAMGLMGSAQAAAGIATLTTVGGLSMAGGLMALAASAAAAAGSVKLLYDAIKEDPKLAKAVGETVFTQLYDRFGALVGVGPGTVDNTHAKPSLPATVGDQPTPMSQQERAKQTYNAPADWQMDEARKETDRVRLDYGPQQDANGGISRIEGMVSNLNAHLGRMTGDAVSKQVDATITDARQDNRQYPVSVATTVNQTVNNMGAAIAGAAAAVGAAVSNAATKAAQTARTEGSPAF